MSTKASAAAIKISFMTNDPGHPVKMNGFCRALSQEDTAAANTSDFTHCCREARGESNFCAENLLQSFSTQSSNSNLASTRMTCTNSVFERGAATVITSET